MFLWPTDAGWESVLMQLGFTACALPLGTATVTLLLYVHVLVNLSAYMYLQVATISYIVHCILAVGSNTMASILLFL